MRFIIWSPSRQAYVVKRKSKLSKTPTLLNLNIIPSLLPLKVPRGKVNPPFMSRLRGSSTLQTGETHLSARIPNKQQSRARRTTWEEVTCYRQALLPVVHLGFLVATQKDSRLSWQTFSSVFFLVLISAN